MKNTDILSRITALLNKKVNLEQQTLDNGTVIESDSFTVGDPIFAIDGTNKVPLGIGTYTLADGSELEVTEIGIIGEIATPATEKSEGEPMGMDEDLAKAPVADLPVAKDEVPAEMTAVPATLEEIVKAVTDALQPQIDALELKYKSMNMDQKEMKATLSSTIAKKPLVHKPTEKVSLSNIKVGENISSTEALIMARLSK